MVKQSHFSNRRLQRHRDGLTLLELVAVVLLLGLIASVSAIGFGSSLAAASRRQSLESWLFYDQQCRTLADRSNQIVLLTYDPKQRTITRKVGLGRSQSQRLAEDIDLLEIEGLAADGSQLQDNQVLFNPTGMSQSYLILQRDNESRLVLGATGQQVKVTDSVNIRKLFAHE